MRSFVAPLASFLFLTLSISQNVNGFSFLSNGRLATRPAFASSDRTLKRDRQGRPHLYLSATRLPDEDPEEPLAAETETTASDYYGPLFAKELKTREGRGDRNVGGYDPSERIGASDVKVGDPQIKVLEKERSVTSILRELAAIQQQGPQKYCILGTRHCSFLHQQIIELLAYALVLSGNHVYTSGAGGTHAATIRGALRAERPELLTVVIPQSMSRQTKESQELLKKVEDLVTMPQNDEMSLDVASRICNSYLLSQADQLISFAFHESSTVIEATKEAKELDMLVTVLFLD